MLKLNCDRKHYGITCGKPSSVAYWVIGLKGCVVTRCESHAVETDANLLSNHRWTRYQVVRVPVYTNESK